MRVTTAQSDCVLIIYVLMNRRVSCAFIDAGVKIYVTDSNYVVEVAQNELWFS